MGGPLDDQWCAARAAYVTHIHTRICTLMHLDIPSYDAWYAAHAAHVTHSYTSVHTQENGFHLQIHADIMYSQIHTCKLMSGTPHTPRLSHTATQCTALQHSLAQNALNF